MDPLSQGLLGAVAAQSFFARRLGRPALLVGLAAGMAADADVLIRSPAEPILGLIYHRHFTHALVFIPLGAAVAAAAFMLLPWGRRRAAGVYAAALAAYATHGLLDATTSYGTLLLWPFSSRRVAWDLIAIIDPLFTGLLLLGVLAAVIWRRALPARLALAAAVLYLGFGFVEHHRAEHAAATLATERGHHVEHPRVMPTLGSLARWRSVYIADGRIWADQVRTPLTSGARAESGQSAALVPLDDALQLAAAGPSARQAIEAFYWFADGYVGLASRQPLVLTDLRYSLDPGGVQPLWGLLVDPGRVPAGYAWVSLGHRPHSLLRILLGGQDGGNNR